MTENQKDDLGKAGDVLEAKPQKKPYEKPVIIEKPGMTFTKEIMEQFSMVDHGVSRALTATAIKSRRRK